MVKVRWKLKSENVYLELDVLKKAVYYWFPKRGRHKRFHPRSIFTRPIIHRAYRDNLIPKYVGKEGWIEGELRDELVKEKLGIQVLTETEYYEQLAKAC